MELIMEAVSLATVSDRAGVLCGNRQGRQFPISGDDSAKGAESERMRVA